MHFATREVPLGRAALWWCLGLGAGICLGFIYQTGVQLVHPQRLVTISALSVVGLVIPAGLGALAGMLLLIGIRPAQRIEVSRRSAELLLRYGIPGYARITRCSPAIDSPTDPTLVSLCIKTTVGRIYYSALRWHLDPVDMIGLRVGAVIPVRIDPASPEVIALDTRADLREGTRDELVSNDFPVRPRLRDLVRRLRRTSWCALSIAAVSGILVGLNL